MMDWFFVFILGVFFVFLIVFIVIVIFVGFRGFKGCVVWDFNIGGFVKKFNIYKN